MLDLVLRPTGCRLRRQVVGQAYPARSCHDRRVAAALRAVGAQFAVPDPHALLGLNRRFDVQLLAQRLPADLELGQGCAALPIAGQELHQVTVRLSPRLQCQQAPGM
jgi:hypothetical protein